MYHEVLSASAMVNDTCPLSDGRASPKLKDQEFFLSVNFRYCLLAFFWKA